jgi:formate hydrogenlyase transcriptional activator
LKRIGPLLQVIHAIGEARDRDELFAALSRTARSVIPMDVFGLVVIDDAVEHFLELHIDPPMSFDRFGRKVRERAAYRSVVEQRPGVYTRADALRFPPQIAMWDELGIQSELAIPLVIERRVIGGLVGMSRDLHAFDDVDLAFAAELGRAVGIALDRVDAAAQLEQLRDRAEADNEVLTSELRLHQLGGAIVGRDPALAAVRRRVELVAQTASTVLLLGESGTGKDLIARAIHEASPRHDRPMVSINCAALPAKLAESELFGHEQGAFTGALRRRMGKFEAASGSTLFLDEIGELALPLQAKLLRVLQERELERVGGHETLRVDVRVIAATNRDLTAAVAAGTFREDLFYRLSVFPIRVPPLRDRRGDIPALVETFIARAAERLRVPRRSVDAESMQALCAYPWPGNVRELQNLIERAMIVSPGDALDVAAVLPCRR